MATVRLQKILARAGIASRRAAEQLITAGRVRVNGRTVSELGAQADPRADRIEVDGARLVAEALVYVVLHKPRGVVATLHDPEGRPTVGQLLAKVAGRVYPVGRLDFATSGVLLATNDGDFADAILHPRRAVPKTYVVKVKGAMQPEDLERWRAGVRLEDGMTAPAEAKLLRYEGDKTWFELTIHEGKNQQIRRMGEATGFPVMRLARLSVAGITAAGLRPGEWRLLSPDELRDLKKVYGVPKRIPAAPQVDAHPQSEPKRPRRPHDDARSRGHAGRSDARGERPRTGRAAPAPQAPPAQGRYGGGSPGRRSPEVREDWGGGIERGGRSPVRHERSGRNSGGSTPARSGGGGARSGGPPGRGGVTRTTGTSGGVGGAQDDAGYRISRTRKPR